MKNGFYISILLLLFCNTTFYSQNKQLDSLKLALKIEKADSNRIFILCQLAETAGDDEWPQFNEQALNLCESVLQKLKPGDPFLKTCKKMLANSIHNKAFLIRLQGDPDKALELHERGLKIMQEIGDKKGVVQTYNFIGGIYLNKGNVQKALELFNKCLEVSKEMKYERGMADAYLNRGIIFQLQGNIQLALENYHKALKIFEEENSRNNIAHVLNNMGLINYNQNDLPEAYDLYSKSLDIYLELKDHNGSATNYNNIALIYKKMGDNEKAIEYFEKSYSTYAFIPDQKGMALSLNNQGALRFLEGETMKALDLHSESLQMFTKIDDKLGIAQSLNYLGTVYIKLKKYSKAEDLSLKSIAIGKQLGFPDVIKSGADNLVNIYSLEGDFKRALENLELSTFMNDSIVNESNRKANIKSQLNYEYQKKAMADSVAHVKEIELRNTELGKQKAEIKAQRNRQLLLYGGLGLLLILSGFIYSRYKLTTKQKEIIEQKERETQKQNTTISLQKDILEEKQKEILDSIQYAKRIQQTLITSEVYIHRHLERLNKSHS